ncbi:SPla/RYanodine receptor SPRY [Penicillium argentinense]|uniref:Protein FYV10 n=1 Tax=Penicillium argentinense TaxID=1131581 RepID=A0A9W9G0F2_9EURO|nr:SPla/RYanodine receptor SPRY [Penicillium argentinense]KAJ5109737.1 SPla/RYanodine receptor SPRY [Penicillium argentinense]
MTDLPPGGARGAPTYTSPGRRSSYASVVSGTAFSPPISNSLTNILNDSPSYPPSSSPDGRPRRTLSGADADMQSISISRNMTSADAVPPESRRYCAWAASDSEINFSVSESSSSFTPSYLIGSAYIEGLEEAQRAKLVAQHREANGSSTATSNPPLSTSSSNIHLPRMAPSHRGMTYDIIEKEPPLASDQPMPLPSQWSADDGKDVLEITGNAVRYTGPLHKTDHEAAAVRADHPMPAQCGIYYFEVRIEAKPYHGYVPPSAYFGPQRTPRFVYLQFAYKRRFSMVAIGFSSTKASLERLPGWETESWAYHGDDGKSFFGESQGQGRTYGPQFTVGDIIGCGVNFHTREAFFTKNGIFLGVAFTNIPDIPLFPSVGLKRQPPVYLVTNFGRDKFCFDIDKMVKPPLNEASLMQELVAQFLAHDGYVETARAFAEDVAAEAASLQSGNAAPLNQYEVEEDHDAIRRNRKYTFFLSEEDSKQCLEIRSAILDGNIDKALKLTTAHYESVLEAQPQIQFKLRCRKFIEMMRNVQDLTEAMNDSKAEANLRSRPASPNNENAIFDQEMELDGSENMGGVKLEPEDLKMDTDGDVPSPTVARFNELLTEAVQYGQRLRLDYNSGGEGVDLKMLDEVFSLVCYADPKSSIHGHYLDSEGRVAVAEELNSAILVSLGKSSEAALERLYRQTEVLVKEISDGGPGAFINVRNDLAWQRDSE